MIILITGGIGSGKSVVSRVLRCMGYEVYDCDSRAKDLMDGSPEIHRRLRHVISPETVNPDGSINRAELSRIVFADPAKLAALNAIVHGAVREDIRLKAEGLRHKAEDPITPCALRLTPITPILFVETAIPVSGGMAGMADAVWEVSAPEQLRISRVQQRSGLSPDQIRARIAAQHSEQVPGAHVIVNDNRQALLPQILKQLTLLH